MQVDARMDEVARARSRACLPRQRSAHALGGGAHAVVALLLLLLLPLGLVHRSSTAACRHGHPAAVAGGAGHGVGVDAPAGASAGHEHIVAGDQHDHREGAVPLDGAAPSACGPAILEEHPAPASAVPHRSAPPDWRALSPLALAPPPPAPPPRLS